MMKTTTHEVIVEGVILKRTLYRENDVILHVYTKDYGKIGVIARGVRKMTSKNAGACQDLTMSELTIHLKKGLSSLIKASSLNYFHHIKTSLESEIVANYILEYFYRYLEDNNPQHEEYDILTSGLNALNEGYPPLLVYLMFQVFILSHNGVTLDVDGCVVCGSSKVVGISLQNGGFVCSDHLGTTKTCEVEVLKAFRHIHKIPIQHIEDAHIGVPVLKALVPLMDHYIDEYTGVSLKTSLFVQQIV